MIKGVHTVDRVSDYYPMGILVETLGDVFEPLLSRGVPDVETDLLALDLHPFDLEVDADSGEEI